MREEEFHYTPLFPQMAEPEAYRKLKTETIPAPLSFEGEEMISVPDSALATLAREAFIDINHYLRSAHLEMVAAILKDQEASENDRFVALELLKNANIAAGGVLPMCQDTGTAIISAHKGRRIWTKGNDEAVLTKGIWRAYQDQNFRYSQLSPLSMFKETNTRTNLPAQIEIHADGEDEYHFLFIAKGGGSANKSFLFQPPPSLLSEERLMEFLDEKLRTLGTSACPPYHLAIVVGGLSAELTLKTAKLASCRALDGLPSEGGDGKAIRDRDMEEKVMKLTRNMGIGAQFGGKYFCHEARVIRLPRHGASLPIAIAVSCSADRQACGKITRDGVFLEKLERDPARFLPDISQITIGAKPVTIDLNKPMKEILENLAQHPIRTRLLLNGPIIVARDAAHARLREKLEKGEPLPDSFKNHPIYYAGPAKTPEGYPSGSFGPTTAGRMDGYVDQFQSLGASMIMLAKGNRSAQVRIACKKHGGFYLGSIGGAAANLAAHVIKKVDVVDFEDLGMEAIWRIEVENFPAFIIIDDKGNDFFAEIDHKNPDFH